MGLGGHEVCKLLCSLGLRMFFLVLERELDGALLGLGRGDECGGNQRGGEQGFNNVMEVSLDFLAKHR